MPVCCVTMSAKVDAAVHCGGCVYYPPNLPRRAYSVGDWAVLQGLSCSFEYVPGGAECLAARKTSCSLIDLEKMNRGA